MTRAQRIALAMLRPRPAKAYAIVRDGELVGFTDRMPPLAAHCCYEAMDDLDPYQDVNPSDRIEHAPLMFAPGNYGCPCA